jgi:hypothetical protein
MSCTHLMPAIRCVWPVTYAFNALPAPHAWRGHDGPDVRRLGNARVRPGAESHWARGGSGALPHQEVGLEPQDTWQYRSPVGRWSWCLSHMVTPEPSCAGAGLEPRGTWRLRSLPLPGDGLGARGTPEPSPSGWCAQCLGARGDTEALSWRVARSVPCDTWRHRSPLLTGGVLYASGHVAEPEPSSTGNGAGAVGLIF